MARNLPSHVEDYLQERYQETDVGEALKLINSGAPAMKALVRLAFRSEKAVDALHEKIPMSRTLLREALEHVANRLTED